MHQPRPRARQQRLPWAWQQPDRRGATGDCASATERTSSVCSDCRCAATYGGMMRQDRRSRQAYLDAATGERASTARL